MTALPYCWFTNRILQISARGLENLIYKFRVIHMVVKSSCLFMVPPDCLIRVESTPVGYIKWGICFNTQTEGWERIALPFALIVRLKLRFLFSGMNKYDRKKSNAPRLSQILGVWIN